MWLTRVSDPASSEACVNGIIEKHGSIDVLVNNAGITRDSTFRKMTLEQWDEVMNANLRGVFNMTRLCINPMLENKWGRIINISSVNGQRPVWPDQLCCSQGRHAWFHQVLSARSRQ